MDNSTLVTIVITAVVSVIAKELMLWVISVVKSTTAAATVKAKLVVVFTRTNVAILTDILAFIFYCFVLAYFAIAPDAPSRIEILLSFFAAIFMLVMAFSLTFRIVRARRKQS